MSRPDLSYEEFLSETKHTCDEDCREECHECSKNICLLQDGRAYIDGLYFCINCLEKIR